MDTKIFYNHPKAQTLQVGNHNYYFLAALTTGSREGEMVDSLKAILLQ